VITPAGIALLDVDDERLQHEVYLRQLLKYQLPSPIERGSAYEGFDVLPFRVVIRVVSRLRELGYRGITKEQIALYVVTTIRNDDWPKAADDIIVYERLRGMRNGLVAKKKFFGDVLVQRAQELYGEDLAEDHKRLEQIVLLHHDKEQAEWRNLLSKVAAGGKGSNTRRAQDFIRQATDILARGGSAEELWSLLDGMRLQVKGETLVDYADTTVRYCALTGLFSLSGDKLVFVEDRLPLVERLVEEGFPGKTEEEYLSWLYSDCHPVLPTDDTAFIGKYVSTLEEKRNALRAKIVEYPERPPAQSVVRELRELKAYRFQLEAEVAAYAEEIFYREQASPEAVADIHDYFDGIRHRTLLGGNAYLPAFLEWTTWRLFLAINRISGPVSATRNFRIDDQLMPIHHARGGAPDMVFHYGDFTLVCEVTLNTSSGQWNAESEPVPRHVGDVVSGSVTPVYALFVAPLIDPQTAQQFFGQKWFFNGSFRDLDIVPVTIEELEHLLDHFVSNGLGPCDLADTIKAAIRLKAGCPDGFRWRQAVSNMLKSTFAGARTETA
jgi:hypothetical protein